MADSDSLTIRIDPALKAELLTAAAADDRSVTSYVVRSIRERLDREGDPDGHRPKDRARRPKKS